jgi:sugar lactone lactonase YvrE
VATGLNTLRGLALSPDGATLYVAEAIPHRIRAYAREASGALRRTRTFALRAVPDRLNSDSAGRLWLAAQPRLFRRALHRLDARFDAPSLALRLDPAQDSVDIVYAGQGIADARIVLPVADKLLLAARDSTAVVICE